MNATALQPKGEAETGSTARFAVLYPTDFSPEAEAAWQYALGLARAVGAELHLLHVLVGPPKVIGDGVIIDYAGVTRVWRAEARAALAGLMESARRQGVEVRSDVKEGLALEEVVHYAEEHGIALIVMGTGGWTGLDTLGQSLTADVVRLAPCPVVALPAAPGDPSLPYVVDVRRILVPLDGSSLGERVLPVVARLAKRFGAEMLLLRTAWAHTLLSTRPAEAELHVIRAAEKYVAAVAERLAAAGIRTRQAVRYGHPAIEILDHAEANHADLIVMATHGRGGLGRTLFGSVAGRVVSRARVPVLLIGPHVDQGEQRAVEATDRAA
ncbi:MAG TPA: universal stress protein [Candidatus Sulfotelmatobacter sp.]|nr:universal stress protein [Candidatus Sulfotelmatobacter sp.]